MALNPAKENESMDDASQEGITGKFYIIVMAIVDAYRIYHNKAFFSARCCSFHAA